MGMRDGRRLPASTGQWQPGRGGDAAYHPDRRARRTARVPSEVCRRQLIRARLHRQSTDVPRDVLALLLEENDLAELQGRPAVVSFSQGLRGEDDGRRLLDSGNFEVVGRLVVLEVATHEQIHRL